MIPRRCAPSSPYLGLCIGPSLGSLPTYALVNPAQVHRGTWVEPAWITLCPLTSSCSSPCPAPCAAPGGACWARHGQRGAGGFP